MRFRETSFSRYVFARQPCPSVHGPWFELILSFWSLLVPLMIISCCLSLSLISSLIFHQVSLQNFLSQLIPDEVAFSIAPIVQYFQTINQTTTTILSFRRVSPCQLRFAYWRRLCYYCSRSIISFFYKSKQKLSNYHCRLSKSIVSECKPRFYFLLLSRNRNTKRYVEINS